MVGSIVISTNIFCSYILKLTVVIFNLLDRNFYAYNLVSGIEMLYFIPIDYVVGVFYKLKEKIEENKFIELFAFVDYFEKQYI